MAGVLNINGTQTGVPSGSNWIQLALTMSNTEGGLILTGGAAQYQILSAVYSAAGVIVIPPTGNTFTITLQGATSDVGVGLSTTQPTLIAVNSPNENLWITLGGTSTAGPIQIVYV